jgi:hypothetical protein
MLTPPVSRKGEIKFWPAGKVESSKLINQHEDRMEDNKKASYGEELYERVGKWWVEHIKGTENPYADDLFRFIRDIALESYKNGVAAGRRRARSKDERP